VNCIPSCLSCKARGQCPEPLAAGPVAVPANQHIGMRQPWRPNDHSEDIYASCGCTVPWPAVTMLIQAKRNVFCSQHGWHTITPAKIKQAQKLMGTFYLPSLDIPPF
jgi:hypothetical protein